MARFRRNSLTANPSPLRYGEYIDYIIYSGAVGLIICVGTYAVHYVRTLQAVRRLLEREVDTLSEKLALYADGLGDEQKGDLQEAQLHASDMLNVVPENTSLVGGRAESAAEFLQQMKERDNAGMGPKLSWGRVTATAATTTSTTTTTTTTTTTSSTLPSSAIPSTDRSSRRC